MPATIGSSSFPKACVATGQTPCADVCFSRTPARSDDVPGDFPTAPLRAPSVSRHMSAYPVYSAMANVGHSTSKRDRPDLDNTTVSVLGSSPNSSPITSNITNGKDTIT